MTSTHHVAATRLHDPTIRAALRRFPQHVRGAVKTVAALDTRLADLAVSFPALLFKLSHPDPGFDPWPGKMSVVDGRRLPDVARLVALPLWTRRLPPEAFHAPIGALPDGPDIALRIVNRIPKAPDTGVWLSNLREAFAIADGETALWVAGLKQDIPTWQMRRLCLWVWFTRRPAILAARLAGAERWSSNLQYGEASVRCGRWVERCDFYIDAGEDGTSDPWFKPVTVDGLTFRPLKTLADVSSAARLMKNCALSYAGSLADGSARLWLVTRGPDVVAMVELRRVVGAGSAYAVIGQVRGVANTAVPRAVQAAIYRWWTEQPADRLAPTTTGAGDILARPAYHRCRAIWTPYLLAKRPRPDWLHTGYIAYLADV